MIDLKLSIIFGIYVTLYEKKKIISNIIVNYNYILCNVMYNVQKYFSDEVIS